MSNLSQDGAKSLPENLDIKNSLSWQDCIMGKV